MRIRFWVPGVPVAQGSKVAGVTKLGKPYLRDVKPGKLRAWRQAVAVAAITEKFGYPGLEGGPVYLFLEFHMPRGKTVKRDVPCVTPDLDKLQRAVLDALTGVAYKDDGQVVHVTASKVYEGYKGPGVVIEVRA